MLYFLPPRQGPSSDFPSAHISYLLPRTHLRSVSLPTATPLPISRFQISDFLATVRSLLLINTPQQTVLPPHQRLQSQTHTPSSLFLLVGFHGPSLFCFHSPSITTMVNLIPVQTRPSSCFTPGLVPQKVAIEKLHNHAYWLHFRFMTTFSMTWEVNHSAPVNTSFQSPRWRLVPSHSSYSQHSLSVGDLNFYFIWKIEAIWRAFFFFSTSISTQTQPSLLLWWLQTSLSLSKPILPHPFKDFAPWLLLYPLHHQFNHPHQPSNKPRSPIYK